MHSDPDLPPDHPVSDGASIGPAADSPGAGSTWGKWREAPGVGAADPVSIGVTQTQGFGQLYRETAVVSNH